MDNTQTTYFSKDALEKMISVQGKSIKQIIIFLWQNNIDASNSIEVIDGIELRFQDQTKISICCDKTSEGLDVTGYDFKQVKKDLEEEFSGKIILHALDASKTKMWLGIEGKILQEIQLTKENDYYKSDSVLLNFGDEKRAICISPSDGLIIDFYDEE